MGKNCLRMECGTSHVVISAFIGSFLVICIAVSRFIDDRADCTLLMDGGSHTDFPQNETNGLRACHFEDGADGV